MDVCLHVCLCVRDQKKTLDFLQQELDGCEPLHESWEPSLGPLQEQPVLSLRSIWFYCFRGEATCPLECNCSMLGPISQVWHTLLKWKGKTTHNPMPLRECCQKSFERLLNTNMYVSMRPSGKHTESLRWKSDTAVGGSKAGTWNNSR